MTTFGFISTAASVKYTPVAIDAFLKTTPLTSADDAIVVDNDGSLEGSDFPPLRYVRNVHPLGFAENANALLRNARSRSEDCIILNNDLILSAGWRERVSEIGEQGITVPLSNRELQYTLAIVNNKTRKPSSQFALRNPTSLDEFRGHEHAFAAIAEAHARENRGLWPVYVAPFFCVRIPLTVSEAIGDFDESFGRGGGEDYDYALRARLAGFQVCFALGSYVLHFGGKSSWDGAETTEEQAEREKHFFARFEEKWGTPLYRYIMREDASAARGVLSDLHERERSGDFIGVLRDLMGRLVVQLKI